MNNQLMTLRPRHRWSTLVTIIRYILVVSLVGVVLFCMVAISAANATSQPYGGCKEAGHSQGADDCRSLGWVISRQLVVTDRGIVMYSTLPHCEFEDGSYTHLPTPHRCTWNIGPSQDGNGGGLAYWFGWKFRDHDRVTHYLWPDDPTATGPWTWVKHRLAQRLAEGDGDFADQRPWHRCVTRTPGAHRWVMCPDGLNRRVS